MLKELKLNIDIENNSSASRGRKRSIEAVQVDMVMLYGMKKKSSTEYDFTLEYKDDADLEKQVFEILNSIESTADMHNCFSESAIFTTDGSGDCW